MTTSRQLDFSISRLLFKSSAENPAAYSAGVSTFAIVGEMRRRGWIYCTIQSCVATGTDDKPDWDDKTMRVEWWCEFSRYRSPVAAASDHCDSPWEAICEAALRAVDEDEAPSRATSSGRDSKGGAE